MAYVPHICVFCGSQRGRNPAYEAAARALARILARKGIGLVYGGGSVGLMGALADEALAAGGRVVGVIPEPLTLKEITHAGLSELHVVPGMHERKAMMAGRCSAFVTLPGGLGTLEEFFEILSWAVLGLHAKPIGLLNVEHYFDPLLAMLNHCAGEGFVRAEHLDLILVGDDPETLLDRLLSHVPPSPGPLWVDLSQT